MSHIERESMPYDVVIVGAGPAGSDEQISRARYFRFRPQQRLRRVGAERGWA